MRYKYLLILILPIVLFSCRKEHGTVNHPGTPPQAPPQPPNNTTLLKDIVIPNLPSPYYHFEYNSDGQVKFASFASDFTRYDVVYFNDQISEMRNNTAGNTDVLKYMYNSTNGTVTDVWYVRNADVVAKVHFTYDDARRLINVDREKKLGTDFIKDRVLSMTYHPDGNLFELNYHYFPFNGSPESIFTDRFEQYDNKINVDGFGLLKNEFFDHLILLPGVTLQINNPGKETRTGTQSDYINNYTYSYNDKNVPLTKIGQLTITSGTDVGRHFQTTSLYSYY